MMQIMYALLPERYDEIMKNSLPLCSAMLVLLCTAQPAQATCTVCHSKNPKMVSMHKALQYKDCFKCHGPASERKTSNARNEMTTDPLCVNCHAAETTNVKE